MSTYKIPNDLFTNAFEIFYFVIIFTLEGGNRVFFVKQ